jgi:hypothetical protein
MVPRDKTAESQIAAAKVMPNANADESDDRSPDPTGDIAAARVPVAGRPGMPGDKPGYRG